MKMAKNLRRNYYCFSTFPCCNSSRGILTSLSPSATVFSGADGSSSAPDCSRDATGGKRIALGKIAKF